MYIEKKKETKICRFQCGQLDKCTAGYLSIIKGGILYRYIQFYFLYDVHR